MSSKKPKKKKDSDSTTIAVSRKTTAKLNEMRRGFEDYDDVLTRLLNSQADVYAEFILIDNELPQLHTCIFQLGEDTNSLFIFDGNTIKPITLAEVNKVMKQPKPNITLTREEAELVKEMDERRSVQVWTDAVPKAVAEWDKRVETFLKRIESFLENQPSAEPEGV